MDQRLGVIGLVIEDRTMAGQVNHILSEHAEIIVGRMGLPYQEKQVSLISLMIDGTTNQIGSLTGKLGNLNGVQVKSAISKKQG